MSDRLLDRAVLLTTPSIRSALATIQRCAGPNWRRTVAWAKPTDLSSATRFDGHTTAAIVHRDRLALHCVRQDGRLGGAIVVIRVQP